MAEEDNEHREPQTIEEWREAAEKSWDHYRRERQRLSALVSRVEPVCRNCANAGPLTFSGNAPYKNSWASCRAGAPAAGPRGELVQYTQAPSADWPSVHHANTCRRFVLVPLSTEQAREVRDVVGLDVEWAAMPPLPQG